MKTLFDFFKKWIRIEVLFLVLFLSCDSSLKFHCHVDRVVDGDTIVCNQKKIRLANIDTFETRKNKRFFKTKKKFKITDEEELLFGGLAKSFLKKTVLDQEVLISVTQEKDVYRRVVGYVIYDGENINFELISLGLAVPDIFVHDSNSNIIKNLALDAQRSKRGVWSHIEK